jgi:hypothetical protein
VEKATVRLCRSMPECSMMPPGESSPDAMPSALWKHQIVAADEGAQGSSPAAEITFRGFAA